MMIPRRFAAIVVAFGTFATATAFDAQPRPLAYPARTGTSEVHPVMALADAQSSSHIKSPEPTAPASKTKLSATTGVAALSTPFKIFCDLDGVLCDFSKGVHKVSGRTPDQFGHNSLMWRALSGVHDFYETLDWTHDGRRLWGAIRHMQPDILTGVPPCKYAPVSKARWCERELGVQINHIDKAGAWDAHHVVNGKQPKDGMTNVITCWSKNKYHESRDNAVLIDDRLDLGRKWEAAGGIFIHHTDTERTLEQLRDHGILDDDI